MKRTLTLLVCLLAVSAAQAQETFPLQFVDKDGSIIPDGAEVDITDYEEDEFFGDILMPVNVSVRNVSNAEVQGGACYTVKSISGGWFQTCFPSVCMRQMAEGTYTTGRDAFVPGQSRGLQTEWLPEEEGTCVVAYQLQTYRKVGNSYLLDGEGPTVTFHFFYGASGIEGAKGGRKVSSVSYYDLTGQAVEHPLHGVFLKKTTYPDGSVDVQKRLFR